MKKSKSSSKTNQVKTQTKSSLINITPLSLCLLLGLAMFTSFSINIDNGSPLYHSLSKLQKYPDESISHINLTRLYTLTNKPFLAQTEIQLASTSNTNNQTQVLGETSDITQLRSLLLEKPLRQQKIKVYWEKVTSEHPFYRDAWVQLLYVAQNDQDKVEIEKYKETIRHLDPNYNFERFLERE